MASLSLVTKNKSQQKIVLELDAFKFEKLMADFGYFSDDFLACVDRAEKDIKAGRIYKSKSLKEIKK
jgi:hypothetical protein